MRTTPTHDEDQARDDRQATEPGRQATRKTQQTDGDEGPRRQLPRAREGAEEGPRRLGVGPVEAEAERGPREDHDDEAHPADREEASRQQEDQRPQQVELLLHAQRPVVQERRGQLRGEVVGRLHGEAEVGHVQRGGRGVSGDLGQAQGRHDERRHDQRDHDDQQPCRQQAPHAPGVEADQVELAGALPFAQQQAGDEEAGDDVEDVHTDEAALGEGDAHVEEQHRDDRDRAQALDVRPVVAGPAFGRRCDVGAGRRNGRQLPERTARVWWAAAAEVVCSRPRATPARLPTVVRRAAARTGLSRADRARHRPAVGQSRHRGPARPAAVGTRVAPGTRRGTRTRRVVAAAGAVWALAPAPA